jgi:hypothetical protein
MPHVAKDNFLREIVNGNPIVNKCDIHLYDILYSIMIVENRGGAF